ncbi:MAG: hypothetical protein WC549_01860 [Actinomycetota bacterium]
MLRLRIRIGDTFTSAGNAFVLSPSSNLNLDGSAVTSQELVDIYNFAVRDFVKLMAGAIPKSRWGFIMPGYIITVPEVAPESTPAATALSADFIKLANVKSGETVYEIIQIKAVAGTPLYQKKGHNIGVYYPPNLLYEVTSDDNKTYKDHTMFTIANTLVTGTDYSSTLVITPKSTTPANSKYAITFLKDHVDLVQGSATDLSYSDIPKASLDMILNLAEREYIARRQFDNFEMNAQRVNDTMNVIRR